jgi:hypothetical protein
VFSTAPRLLNLASLSRLASVHGVIGNAGRPARFATLPDFGRVVVLAVFSLPAGFTALLLPLLLVALRGFFIVVVPSAGADLPALAILRGLLVLLLLALAEPLATLSALFFPEPAGSCVLPTLVVLAGLFYPVAHRIGADARYDQCAQPCGCRSAKDEGPMRKAD